MSALSELAARLSSRRVAVIGDVMLDHFLIGRVDRISPEAPVPVVRFERDEYRLGGAANVAHNIRALGAAATLIGVVGEDDSARQVRHELVMCGVDPASLVTDKDRPTTRKVRVVTSRNQQVARLDYERDSEIEGEVLDRLRDQISVAVTQVESVVLSDYRKGVVGPAAIEAASRACQAARLPLLVDPKVPQSERYRGATLITPNHHEAELMTARLIRNQEDAKRAARDIYERSGASVLITLGEQGMWLLDAAGAGTHEEGLAAAAREVSDVTGAGDTVIAVLALTLAAGARLADAARLANLAAGLVVARFGPAVVTPHELAAAIGE